MKDNAKNAISYIVYVLINLRPTYNIIYNASVPKYRQIYATLH